MTRETGKNANIDCGEPALAPAEAFLADFRRRAPAFGLRRASADDAPFLRRLFLAAESQVQPLPAPLLEMQYASRQAAYAELFPSAMDVVAERAGRSIGRMLIDWEAPEGFLGVDLAVLPEERSGAAGLHLLRAWVHTADLFRRKALLRVRPRAPVVRLYRRLGFVAAPGEAVPLEMVRPPGPVRRAPWKRTGKDDAGKLM